MVLICLIDPLKLLHQPLDLLSLLPHTYVHLSHFYPQSILLLAHPLNNAL